MKAATTDFPRPSMTDAARARAILRTLAALDSPVPTHAPRLSNGGALQLTRPGHARWWDRFLNARRR